MALQDLDPRGFFPFMAMALAFGAAGSVLGLGINALVDTSPHHRLIRRVAFNALLLWSLLVALPWSVVTHAQNSLPGMLFGGILISIQSWAAPF